MFCLAAAWSLFNCGLHAQTPFEKLLRQKIDSLFAAGNNVAASDINDVNGQKGTYMLSPNDAMQSIMSPTGWGGYGTYIFGGIGAIYPEVYRQNKADLITSFGACTGNSLKVVNVAASINMTDVHRIRDFSANFIISKSINRGNSISAGAMQLFANEQQSDAPGSTFYIAYSHAVQTILSRVSGCSKLSYTIGFGTGRFLYKSPKDIQAGRGKYGTAIFGNISYEIFKHSNLIVEWSGMNLGISLGLRPFKNPLSIGFGLNNLTRYSADKANMILSIGYPLSVKR